MWSCSTTAVRNWPERSGGARTLDFRPTEEQSQLQDTARRFAPAEQPKIARELEEYAYQGRAQEQRNRFAGLFGEGFPLGSRYYI